MTPSATSARRTRIGLMASVCVRWPRAAALSPRWVPHKGVAVS